MNWGAIEVGIKCPKCDNPIPLNGPVEKAHCDHCQADVDVPRDYWTDLLKDFATDIKNEFADDEGRNATIFGTFQTSAMYGKQGPRCAKCKTHFAVADDVAAAYVQKCEKCGAEIPVAPAPDWLRKAEVPVMTVANAILVESSEGEKSTVSGPVAFTCPQCGGALVVDGKERMLPCKFCAVNVYLPDDLWLRLHPAKAKLRWFFGFKDEGIKKEED